MATYIPRIIDAEVEQSLRIAGGVLIRGPRACGKTETARQFAASQIRLDDSTAQTSLARMEPDTALPGNTPRLIDEWQAIPEVWNAIRHEIDDRQARGQFILTGSATPGNEDHRHSGAGRIRSVTMRTMTLAEQGVDAEPASLQRLLAGQLEPSAGTKLSVAGYAERLVGGGWPGFLDMSPADAATLVESYLEDMSHHDYPQIGGPRRDPRRFRAFLAGYAGLIGQPASFAAIRRRIGEAAGTWPAENQVPILHDFVSRLYLIEDQPAWSPALRSRSALIQTPKRHLADPSLALALLGAGVDRVLAEPSTLGIAFESQAVHDLRVYADAAGARGVFHLRDTKGRDEIDVVVEAKDGSWAGMEVKLSHHQVDDAATNLLRIAAKVERRPSALAVIIPTGPVIQRSDGVWVLPLASLRS